MNLVTGWGEPFWGRGYMPEAAYALMKRGFETLEMTTIWCGYYDGNKKSKRVQEKLGFIYHHTCDEVPVPLLNEVRVGHTNVITKEQWKSHTQSDGKNPRSQYRRSVKNQLYLLERAVKSYEVII